MFKVFLSASSKDYSFAQQVYESLTSQNVSVFFSEVSLGALGSADYRREIDRALDEVEHMIVVTSSKEHVSSHWVEAEWGLFLNELRAGRKKGNLISVLCGSMTIAELPASLRYYQALSLNEVAKLSRYVGVQPSAPVTYTKAGVTTDKRESVVDTKLKVDPNVNSIPEQILVVERDEPELREAAETLSLASALTSGQKVETPLQPIHKKAGIFDEPLLARVGRAHRRLLMEWRQKHPGATRTDSQVKSENTILQQLRKPLLRKLLLNLSVATFCGLLFGTYLASKISQKFADWLFFVINGILLTGCLGASQAFVLKGIISPKLWVGAMVTAGVVGFGIGGYIDEYLRFDGIVSVATFGGFCIGVALWWVLRLQNAKGGSLIFANVFGWFVSSLIVFHSHLNSGEAVFWASIVLTAITAPSIVKCLPAQSERQKSISEAK